MTLHSVLTKCFPCLPRSGGQTEQQQQALDGSHRSNYYNTQLRSNLRMPERPLHLPGLLAQDADSLSHVSSYPSTSAANSISEQQQQRPNPRGRFPTAAAGHQRTKAKAYSDTPMETPQLTELFHLLATIDFIPYAICGRGALVDYGLSARKAKQVSIMIPAYSKDVIASWAKSSGWVSTASANPAAVGPGAERAGGKATIFVGIPLSDGTVRQLRIKYLNEEQFEGLERVRACLSPKAWVLSLTSQLDHLAAAWLDHQKQVEEKTAQQQADGGNPTTTVAKHEKPLREIARDIMWTLDRMAQTRAPGTAGPDPGLLQTLSS